MKKLLLLSAAVFAFSNQICFDLNDKNLVEIKKKFMPSYIPKSAAEKIVKKELFFAKKYNLKDKNLVAKLGAIESLANAYREYLKKKYAPNDKVIKSFYMEYKDQFAPQTIVDISSIKVKSIDLADKIYKELKKDPKKFDKLAKKYSLDSNIRYVNLPLDKFAFKVREFIRNAKKGDISEPIKIGEFYYIDRIDNKKIIKPTYENLKPKIKDILVNIYVNRLMKKMYEDVQ